MSKIKYKTIKLKISESVFKDLQSALIIRTMADNKSGLNDQVLIKIMKYITDNEKIVQIEYKKEKEKK